MTDPELTEAQDKVMTEVSDAANRGEPLDVWDALQYLTSIGYVTPMLPPKLDD
jgi:hypothetical protein